MSSNNSQINRGVYSIFSKEERENLPGTRGNKVYTKAWTPLQTVQINKRAEIDTPVNITGQNLKPSEENAKKVWTAIRGSLFTPGNDHDYVVFLQMKNIQARLGRRTVGDGACQFHSVSDCCEMQGFGTIRATDLRMIVIDYMRTDTDKDSPWNTPGNIQGAMADHKDGKVGERVKTKEQYLEYMSKPGSWGDCLTIVAMMKILRINIEVVNTYKTTNVVTLFAYKGESVATIQLIYTGEHYQSLISETRYKAYEAGIWTVGNIEDVVCDGYIKGSRL